MEIGDNDMYLTYYVHLDGIKEVIDDTGKSLFRAGNRNPIYWPPPPPSSPSHCTDWGILLTVLKGNAFEMKDGFRYFWVRL